MASPEPRDLTRGLSGPGGGRLQPIDAVGLEPGMIVWQRCVVGKVRHAAPVWSVAVTDLQREFGRAPHHRVTLQYLAILEVLSQPRPDDPSIRPIQTKIPRLSSHCLPRADRSFGGLWAHYVEDAYGETTVLFPSP